MKEKNIFNIPNLLSAIRLILIPFFLLSVINNQKWASVALFLVISLGDLADGTIARKLKQETYFGKIFDGTTDAIFFFSSLILFTMLGKLNLVYLILLLLPRIFTFSKEAFSYLKTKKITYKTSVYRQRVAALVFILIFLSLFLPDVNVYALIVIIVSYLALVWEYFFKH